MSFNPPSPQFTDYPPSEVTKNMNLYELIKYSIQQNVMQGDQPIDINELNDFIKEALLEAQKLKEKEQSQVSSQRPPSYSENNGNSPFTINYLANYDSPRLQYVHDSVNN